MLPTSRRILLYWLLLLVPALVVGGAAIFLLQREEARLQKQGEYLDEARRAALTAQARLIVENVELFVGDAQAGLLETLATAPDVGLDAFLDRWERSNPLVRTTFRSLPDGRLVRPAVGAVEEEAQGFLRRFSREFARRPPWSPAEVSIGSAAKEQDEKKSKDESEVRKLAAQNVSQAQSARRNLQQTAGSRDYALADSAPTATAAAAPMAPSPLPAAARSRQQEKSEVAPAGVSAVTLGRVESAAAKLEKDSLPDTRGWQPRMLEGRLHVIGWVRPGGAGEFRGVELGVAALVGRLSGALPAEVGLGEGYALRDSQGRVLHQRGVLPAAGEPAVRVPLAATLLPGWEVVAYFTGAAETGGGAGFFWVGALLVAIFVAAILTGGSLLLWQARRSEAEAAQKTSFVANVSHEFKTPLTTIRLYSELLEQGRVRDATQGGEYLRTIGRETQRLARLVNNALDFSRLEQGRKKYSREPVDLRVELTRLLETLAPRMAEAGLTLRRDFPDTAVAVFTDRDALEQIVLNLIDNALKYGLAGGEVSVMLVARGSGGAEVRVGDRGPGVPLEHRERIFEKFHRVDDALTAEKSGAGLGLSIARQLARGQGGEVRYVPRAGGGAEFILELP